MRWDDLFDTVDAWVEKTAAVGYFVRTAAAGVITSTPVGYYVSPPTGSVGLYAPGADAADRALTKAAAERIAPGAVRFLSYQELAAPDAAWVKVAYSPTLRAVGEATNFFPGQYPGGLPNSPSPLAAMLTSGLIGAGLGWGTGKLIDKALPGRFGEHLGRTGAVVGGLLGAAPGAGWAAANKIDGRPLNDPTLLGGRAGGEPVSYPTAMDGSNAVPPGTDEADPLAGARQFVSKMIVPRKLAAALDAAEPCPMFLASVVKAASTFGTRDDRAHTPVDVNINHLGHVLWENGTSPALTASTMGALYAAQQLPDPRARPGWATGHQLGQLALNAAGDYVTGRIVGGAINALVGSPISSPAYGGAAVVAGVLGAVVPKLFGG